MKIKTIIAKNWKYRLCRHPFEDSYNINIDVGTIAVADGVTRDPMRYLPGGLFRKLRFLMNYPKPSQAKIAADIFCETFPLVIRDFSEKDEKAINTAFRIANNYIKNWNKANIPEIDYLLNDYAGCVASATIERGNIISWGFITDCGVAIFDKNGQLSFRTESENPHRLDENIWEDPLIKNKTWNQPEVRQRIRSNYRNNPKEKYSFGVLTGQDEAMHYVKTGTVEIQPGDNLVVYSDGLEQTIFSERFTDRLKLKDYDGISRLCKKEIKTEGTVIIKRINGD